MSKIFNSVPGNKVKRNVFNLSHEKKLSMNMGDLVPIFCQEVVPGDTFKVSSEVMMRFAPMLAPVMHRINVYTHFFFVPNRLVWSGWEDFITGNDDRILPYLPYGDALHTFLNSVCKTNGSLPDYLGVPNMSHVIDGQMKINALPFRAYQLIFNEWYRDQDLWNEVDIYKDADGKADPNQSFSLAKMQSRAWEKDYFTSARPWPQKGDDVELPLSGEADLVFYGNKTVNAQTFRDQDGDPVANYNDNIYTTAGGFLTDSGGINRHYLDVASTHKVDLSSASAATIIELRRAFQLQKWLERNARSGTRYTEVLRAHFGVKSSDSRLQRPEYLGGGRQPVSVSEVLQTAESNQLGSLGDMAGHGVSVGRSNRFKRFFEEHGYVIGIMSVLPRTAYQQGISRFLTKFDKFDFFWPEFQHIGEQEIKVKELYVPENLDNQDETFGYTPRYAEYKYVPSAVHGDFKDSLSYWHMGRIFSSQPSLNGTFIKANPTNRIFNVLDDEHQKLWVHVYHNFKALRPMAVYGEPGLIDH